ncbi:MAG: FapA family protein [Motiliproteus sp.]
MDCISLRLSLDQQFVEAVLAPITAPLPLDESALLLLLAKSQFSQCKPSDDAIRALIEAATHLPAADMSPPVQVFNLAQRLDSVLELFVSDNLMSCEARITTGYGGKPINATTFKQALSDSGVCKGIDTEVASALMKQAYSAVPGSLHKATIAKGLAAVNGDNGRWVSDLDAIHQRIHNPQSREDGGVDMLDFGEILSVKSGLSLMHLEAPTTGTPGFTVTGEVLPATPGTKAIFVTADGVELASDQRHILATRSGMPVELPGGVRVDNVYQVKQVDLASGHVEFDGCVIVHGDVCEMMKVVATGDVMVGGSVQSARIESGGDLIVRKGVVGHQRTDDDQHFNSGDLTCELFAQGRMQLGLAQYARLEAEQGIYVDKELLHCVSRAATELVIGKKGDRNSKLFGGITRAGERVVCGSYGTGAFVPTEIELKPDTRGIDQQAEQLVEAGTLKQQQLQQIKASLPQLSALPKTPENKKNYNMALKQSTDVGNDAVALDLQHKALLEQKKALLANALLIARGTIYPGVSVVIAPYHHKTHVEHQGGGILFQQGEVRYDPSLTE